jgi:subtilisin family serine protease
MLLPDICGPTNTWCTTYPDTNGFGGTSCATPNNAGAACAFWSADPLLSADAVRWLMFEQTELWRDWGTAGADTIYGLGGTILLDYVPNTLWVARSYGNTTDTRDEPFYTIQAAHDAAASGGRLLVFPGGSYPEGAMLTKPLRVETIENSAFLGG